MPDVDGNIDTDDIEPPILDDNNVITGYTAPVNDLTAGKSRGRIASIEKVTQQSVVAS